MTDLKVSTHNRYFQKMVILVILIILILWTQWFQTYSDASGIGVIMTQNMHLAPFLRWICYCVNTVIE